MVELLGLRVRVEQNTEGELWRRAWRGCLARHRHAVALVLRRPNVLTREEKARSPGSTVISFREPR
jgi:hypothetical protein